MKVHKDYAFSEPLFEFGSGVIHAKLRGTMENISDTTSVNHAPYEMLLWFDLGNYSNAGTCSVSVQAVFLTNSKNNGKMLITNEETTFLRQRADGNVVANFSFKNLNLSYADHKLEFVYSFSEKCTVVQSKASVTMMFHKEYNERNISFWDTLMGI